jgi:protein ImuA
MHPAKSDIINRLKREILPLEGLGGIRREMAVGLGLDFMSEAFPQGSFPLGAVHELISEGQEEGASTAGFTAVILAGLMKNGGSVAWIGNAPKIFPPAMNSFGIRPGQVFFIDLKKEKDRLWAIEEALKCSALSAVIGEIPELSFTHSRRFQLAVEQSKTTGFILRQNPKTQSPNACVARWRIKPLMSQNEEGLPGIGHPVWQIELQKIRNGRPGSWTVEYKNGKFYENQKALPSIIYQPIQPTRKTG